MEASRFTKLSIIIPVYNEKKTIAEIIQKIEDVPLPLKKELIIVDDCSTDGTREILQGYSKKHRIIFHGSNKGKGAAVRTGLSRSTGDILIIQDADLEYNPNDYPKLIAPILTGKSKVVYGSRFKSKTGHLKNEHITYYIHLLGNKVLTLVTNMLFLTWITDMETCYKVFTREVYKKIPKLRAARFDLEPEITAKILKTGYDIHEVPIDYFSRSFKEGKKITWKDGLKALYYLLKYRITD